MKYVAIISICLSVYLMPPFHYLIPLLIDVIIPIESRFKRILWIIASIIFLKVDIFAFYILSILLVSLYTMKQVIMLLGKPLYTYLRFYFTLILLVGMLLSNYSYDLCLLSSIAFYGFYPFLRKHKWILLALIPCFYESSIQSFYIATYVLVVSLLFGKHALPLFIFYYVYQFEAGYYILCLLCMLFHQQKKECLLLLCIFVFIINPPLSSACMMFIAMMFLICYEFQNDEINYATSQETTILKLLIDFYEECNEEMSAFLKALSHVFEHLKPNHVYEEQHLIQLLQEYGYQIESLSILEGGLLLKVCDVTRGELCGPLLSLISHTLKQEYQMIACEKEGLCYHVQLGLKVAYVYEYESINLSKQDECGDAYRIFQVYDDIVVLLCDGMGNGHFAHECAYLALRLFHRLCDIGMAMDEIIHCINAMMQSERFTTMDVLRLSMRHQKGQMLKSAACPTLLYRNDTIIELNAQTLPIGMISSLDVDVHTFDIQPNDVFFMMSDGFNLEEVKEWILHHNLVSKEGFAKFKAQFKELQDDATLIKIRVCENM